MHFSNEFLVLGDVGLEPEVFQNHGFGKNVQDNFSFPLQPKKRWKNSLGQLFQRSLGFEGSQALGPYLPKPRIRLKSCPGLIPTFRVENDSNSCPGQLFQRIHDFGRSQALGPHLPKPRIRWNNCPGQLFPIVFGQKR